MIGSAIIALSPQALPANDLLWQKCLTFVNGSPSIVPGWIELRETVTDEKGKIHQDASTTIESFCQNPGIGVHLLEFIENGKDSTEASREMIEGIALSELRSWKKEIPFIADDPSALITGVHPDRLDVNGCECIGYRFEINDSNVTDTTSEPFHLRGTVWVDTNSAVPMRIDTEMLDLPKKDGDAEILGFSRTVTFSTSKGLWQKDSESLDVELKAKMLLGRKNFKVRNRSTFRNHWIPDTATGISENPTLEKGSASGKTTG